VQVTDDNVGTVAGVTVIAPLPPVEGTVFPSEALVSVRLTVTVPVAVPASWILAIPKGPLGISEEGSVKTRHFRVPESHCRNFPVSDGSSVTEKPVTAAPGLNAKVH
jgi:hypothetical protein